MCLPMGYQPFFFSKVETHPRIIFLERKKEILFNIIIDIVQVLVDIHRLNTKTLNIMIFMVLVQQVQQEVAITANDVQDIEMILKKNNDYLLCLQNMRNSN